MTGISTFPGHFEVPVRLLKGTQMSLMVVRVCARTISQRLNNVGLHTRKPVKCILLYHIWATWSSVTNQLQGWFWTPATVKRAENPLLCPGNWSLWPGNNSILTTMAIVLNLRSSELCPSFPQCSWSIFSVHGWQCPFKYVSCSVHTLPNQYIVHIRQS